MKPTALILNVGRWTARILALALFLFWGAFFLEHLQEWFIHPAKGLPPVWVWLGMLAHLGILVGMLALWRWEVAGSLLAVAGSVVFFGGLAIREKLAGHGYSTFLVFLAITIVPPLLTLTCHFARARTTRAQVTPLPRVRNE
jgi:hypothetical protein